ncbi:MAG: plastocyanin/azurin family copper-binding protein [Segetibacter sp.]
MKYSFTLLKKGLYLLFINIVLLSCSTPEERIVNVTKTYTVQIKQMQFQPAELTVGSGDTVVFVNNDMFVHDVTEEVNKAWSSSSMAPGSKWKMVVTEDANYYCSIHVVMKGKLLVRK